MKQPPHWPPPLTTPTTTMLSYFSELMYARARPHNRACPVLRYGDPLHTHSATPRSCQKGLGLPYTGPEGQKQGRKNLTKGPCLSKLEWISLSFGQGPKGPKGRYFQKTFRRLLKQRHPVPRYGRAPSTSQPAPPSACQKGLTRHSSLFTIHYPQCHFDPRQCHFISGSPKLAQL